MAQGSAAPRKTPPHYCLEEPSSGQYIVLTAKGRRLVAQAELAAYRSRAEAQRVGANELQDVGHELVRVDK